MNPGPKRTACVVLSAYLCGVVVSGIGTVGFTVPGGLYLGDSLYYTIWLVWFFRLIGKGPGYVLSGFILAYLLTNTAARRVVAVLMLCVIAVAFYHVIERWQTDVGHTLGLAGTAIHQTGQVATTVVYLVAGLILGTRAKRRVEPRNATYRIRDIATSFEIGDRERHTVDVWFSNWTGLTIFKVDGVEKLRSRSFAMRRRYKLSVGKEESHDLELRRQTFPTWSFQLFVDGTLSIGELFPRMRPLYNTTMLAILTMLGIQIVGGALFLAGLVLVHLYSA